MEVNEKLAIGREHAGFVVRNGTFGTKFLDDLLGLGLGDTTVLRDYLAEDSVDFSCHVCGITAHVKVGFLKKKLIDFFGVLLESVLDINLLWSFSRKCGDEGEFISQSFLVLLQKRSVS